MSKRLIESKAIKIIALILVLIFAFGVFSAVFDGIRIKNNKEPVFVVEKVSENNLTITYYGLGYKIIRHLQYSNLEPFENNIDVKIGTWFLKYKREEVEITDAIFDIVDLTVVENLPCEDAFETFYEDDEYVYQFPRIKSSYVVVHFRTGEQMNVKEALNSGKIKIGDLDEWKIEYTKTKK